MTTTLQTIPGTAEVSARLRRAVAAAGELAAQLERGQGRFPLCDYFRELGAAVDAAAVSVVLVTADRASEAAAFLWLFGSPPPDVSEERGTAFRIWPGESAGTPAPALGGLAEAAVVAPGQVYGAEVAVLGAETLATAGPALLDSLAARANLVVIAAPVAAALTPEALRAASDLAGRAGAAFVALVSADGCEAEPPWAAALAGGVATPVPLGGDRPARPSPLDPRSPLRASLSGFWLAGRFEAALGLLGDRLAQDRRQQDGRRRVLARRTAALADASAGRGAADTLAVVRRRLDDGVGQVEATLADRTRERLLPTAAPANRIRNLLEDLSPEDVTEEEAGRAVTVGVSAAYLARATGLLREMLRGDVLADQAELGAAAAALGAEAAEAVERLTGTRPPIRTPPPDTAACEDLLRAVHVEGDARTEIPRRGLFDLISHGRRPVIMLTMTLSLFATAFGAGALTTQVAPILLAVFVGSVAWSVREFRQDRRERIERDLHRLRQSLGGELRRAYEQGVRDWQLRATRTARELHRELARQAEDPLREWAAENARESARERTEVQDRIKAVELRQRELVGCQQQLERLVQAAAELVRLAAPAGGSRSADGGD